jgi:hypothetical protein
MLVAKKKKKFGHSYQASINFLGRSKALDCLVNQKASQNPDGQNGYQGSNNFGSMETKSVF